MRKDTETNFHFALPSFYCPSISFERTLWDLLQKCFLASWFVFWGRCGTQTPAVGLPVYSVVCRSASVIIVLFRRVSVPGGVSPAGAAVQRVRTWLLAGFLMLQELTVQSGKLKIKRLSPPFHTICSCSEPTVAVMQFEKRLSKKGLTKDCIVHSCCHVTGTFLY